MTPYAEPRPISLDSGPGFLRWLMALVLLLPIHAYADTWGKPHPWRQQALLEGRSFEYDKESFLQRFSFRHLSETPVANEDGVRGTVGSLSSKTAYSEIRFRKRFPFDQGGRAFHLAMQRGEDFDGDYDRQLVGFSQALTDRWTLILRGDIAANKAESDVWFQSRWHAGKSGLVELAAIFPDTLFNDKTARSAKFRERPQTFFARARIPLSSALSAEISANHSPRVELDDRDRNLNAADTSTRASVQLTWQNQHWRARFTSRFEDRERDFIWRNTTGDSTGDFRRDFHQTGLSLTHKTHRLKPAVGLHYYVLDEEGFFGTASNTRGELRRREPLIHTSLRLTTGDRHHLRPELLISRPDLDQQVNDESRWKDRSVDEVLSKLSLPWRYEVNRDDGAVLTISPSLELHEIGFGGGNVQLHWPL